MFDKCEYTQELKTEIFKLFFFVLWYKNIWFIRKHWEIQEYLKKITVTNNSTIPAIITIHNVFLSYFIIMSILLFIQNSLKTSF